MRENLEREIVGRREQSRAEADSRSEFIRNLDKSSISFYITNFPDEAKTVELWKLFARFDRIGEVYIPNKVDKWGKRFGFVKFKEVRDLERLEERLSDVWMGTYKLRINRARFSRTEVGGRSTGGGGGVKNKAVSGEDVATSGRSFRSALMGCHNAVKGQVEKGSEAILVTVEECLLKDLKRSFVGFLANDNEVRRIRNTLYMEGFQDISVKEMGGGMVLLQCARIGVLEGMVKSRAEWLTYYFKEVRPWSPNLVASRRVVWVQVRGIPLHAWGEALFKSLAAKIGVFVDFDESTASGTKLDMARIKISTSHKGLIDTVVKISVQGVLFDIWILEENRGCFGDPGPVIEVDEERSWVESSVFSDGIPADLGVEEALPAEEERSVGFDVMQTSGRPKKVDGDVSVAILGMVDMDLSKSTNKEQLLGDRGSDKGDGLGKGDGMGEKLVEESSLKHGKGVDGFECDVVEGCEDRCAGITTPLSKGVSSNLGVDLYFGPGSSKTSNLGNVGAGLVGSDPFRVLEDVFKENMLVQEGVGPEAGINNNLSKVNCPNVGGGVDSNAMVLSSLSESDTSLANRTIVTIPPIMKKNSNRSKFPQLGVPKCIQLVEAVKDQGAAFRRRKKKALSSSSPLEDSSSSDFNLKLTAPNQLQEEVMGVTNVVGIDLEVVLPAPSATPASGMRLLGCDEGDGPFVQQTVLLACGEGGDIVHENTVLLESQKKLGFTFNTSNEDSLKRMIALEQRDRKLLADLESRGVQ
jgi:hypothetical protein